jgi:outer membrane receptor protein involved in Fe transport
MRRFHRLCPLCCALLLLPFASLLHAASVTAVDGVVRDPSGAPIAEARVILSAAGTSFRAQTDREGHFEIAGVPGVAGSIVVAAPGFSRIVMPWSPERRHIDITLPLSRVEERVSVSATPETPPPNIVWINGEQLASSGALGLDNTLREVPGFSLYRRTPAWSANPTTQGVSLRAVGANGASRALVLDGGIPANDPFGAWVYWGQFVGAAIDRVEVVQGGESDLYGSQAMGGVVNVIRKQPLATHLAIDNEFGNQYTPLGSAQGGLRFGSWNLIASGEGFRTDGYVPTPEAQRGAVDTVVNSQHRTADLMLERVFGAKARAFLGGSYYQESRQNGTVLQTNSANIRELRTGLDLSPGSLGSLSFRVYGGTEGLEQTFSAIAANRNSESLTTIQTVPVSRAGASVLWSRAAGKRQMLLAGLDLMKVDGQSDEVAFSSGAAKSLLNNGGAQTTAGVYGEDRLRLTNKLFLSLGARIDYWNNTAGHSITTPLVTTVSASNTIFPNRSNTAFSPHIGTQYGINSKLTVFVSGQRSFRAPSLNELYRSFRVGNVLTNANPYLTAERLSGGEAGLSYRVNRRLLLRGSYFYDVITNPISNVTLSTTATLITRQRQNLGCTRSEGIDVSAQTKLTRTLTVETAYQYSAAVVLSSPANPALVGLDVPQVPRHAATARLRYSRPKLFTFAVQARYQGRQFDDDQNLLPLGGFFVADVFLSHQLRRGVELYAAADNAFDRRYVVNRSPIAQLGPPVMARAGLRLSFGGE